MHALLTALVLVFLSRFGAFLTSLFTFAQQLVQPPQHFVICAHHSCSFSFLPTNCKCFWTCINCFHMDQAGTTQRSRYGEQTQRGMRLICCL